MNLNKNVRLLTGFYSDEGDHIWGSDNVYIQIINSKYKTVEIALSLGKQSADFSIINCARQEDMPYRVVSNNQGIISLQIDIYDDESLLNIVSSDYLQPCFDLVGSNDYRRLGICIFDIYIKSSLFEEKVFGLKLDKNQSCFLLENFNKKYIHDVDYRFLERFQEIKIPGVFLDIGANIGQSACSIASIHPTIDILSFEPNKLLKNNLEVVEYMLNGRMKFELCGLGNNEKKATFYVPRCGNEYFTQEGSFIREEVESLETMERIKTALSLEKVELEIMEMEFETKTLNNSKIESYFIKIDTQGYEKQALEGLESIINKYRPIILLEKGCNLEEILALLPDYNVYYYNYADGKFITSETNTANVFFIHKIGTNCTEINKLLPEVIR